MSPLAKGLELDRRALDVSRAVAVRFVRSLPVVHTGVVASIGALLLAMREQRELHPARTEVGYG